MTTRELLRSSEILANLPDEDLDRLLQVAEPVAVRAGDVLMAEGSPGDSVQVTLEGEFEITKRSGSSDVVLARRGPGVIFGEMTLLDGSPRMASVRALRDGRVLVISHEAFRETVFTSPAALLAILRTVTARLRNNESVVHQSEKMAALGTLAAGLAHELNNPAAAARRAATQLRDAIAESRRLDLEFVRSGLTPAMIQALSALRDDTRLRHASQPDLDPLARSDREAEVERWLDAHQVASPWEVARTLVDDGWEVSALGGKGSIAIRAQRTEDGVAVSITDDGPGIPEAIQSRVFDPFFTTKPPGVGTGLGLHISHHIIVEKHHGQIQVRSRPGETTFEVSLWLRLRHGS